MTSRTTAIKERASAVIARYRPIGAWVEQPADRQPPLVGSIDADVVVVGGGFAGLSTALELTAAGARVVLLERDFCGFGASGRNAGYLAGGQGLKFGLFAKRLGEERTRAITRFYQEGVAYVEDRIDHYGIDCDYLQTGLLRAAIHPSQADGLRAKMEAAISYGAPATFLDSDELRRRGIPPAFLCATYSPNGGTLHPGKYVLGLRRAALEAGVSIFEDSAVLSWDEGRTITCRTAGGAARAPFLVVATNAYTPALGLLRNRVSPIRVSGLETEPLSPAQLARLGWAGREGIVTPHITMESHRLTVDNRLVVTTKRIDYLYGSRTPNEPDEAAYRALAEALYERFPMIGDVAVNACWSGYISLARDGLPVVGDVGEHGNILYSSGCSGHGVGTQSLIGKLLAQRIGGANPDLLVALQHASPRVPPEPARWIGLKSALRAADFLDGRVNRKARKLDAPFK